MIRSLPILCKIDEYIRHYDIRGVVLRDAAADVLDGAVTRRELDDLIRRRLLTVVPYEAGQGLGFGDDCGSKWSVNLTERAIGAFWPARA